MPLLEIRNLAVEFQTHRGPFRAVDGIDITIDEREVLENAQAVYRRFVERANLAPHTRNPERFWGASRAE